MTTEFFIHYDTTNRRIDGVRTNTNTETGNIAIPITEDQAKKILLENVSVLDWALGLDSEDNWIFTEKSDDVRLASNKDITQLLELKRNIDDADVILLLDNAHACLSINPALTQNRVNQYVDHFSTDTVRFFVTAKNDPRVLLATLDFSLTAMVNDSKFATINTESDYRGCSIFTNKRFLSYKLETTNEQISHQSI